MSDPVDRSENPEGTQGTGEQPCNASHISLGPCVLLCGHKTDHKWRDEPPTAGEMEAVRAELARWQKRCALISQGVGTVEGVLVDIEKLVNTAVEQELGRLGEIARQHQNTEHVDGDRIYRNGWRACAESIGIALKSGWMR